MGRGRAISNKIRGKETTQMITDKLADIDEKLLLTLCTSKASEFQQLEFKRELPSNADSARREFLKDVTALANSGGGDLIYGLADVDEKADRIVPIVGESFAEAQRRLTQILEALAEPRLIGVKFQEVKVTGGYVMVIRVPRSFVGPHASTFDKQLRFFTRARTITSEFRYDQLKTAFTNGADIAEKARSWRRERLMQIRTGETLRPMKGGPLVAIHLMPLVSFLEPQAIDVRSVYHDYTGFMLPDWGGASRTLNLEGLIVHAVGKKEREEYVYVQLFRNGRVEVVSFAGHLWDTEKIIPSTTLGKVLRATIHQIPLQLCRLGLQGPCTIGLSLLGIEGYTLSVDQRYYNAQHKNAERDELILPESLIDELSTVIDADAVARPILDILWQCFDIERSLDYDEKGNWRA